MNKGPEEVKERREAKVAPAVEEAPENGWEYFLFFV